VHLDANALIALGDITGPVWRAVVERVAVGDLPEASAIAWHEFVRGPLPATQSAAELAARLFNLSGRRRASTADCFIAPAAIETDAELITANREDFRLFEAHGLRLLTL
jgi:predicted nucleic acid-binding protein